MREVMGALKIIWSSAVGMVAGYTIETYGGVPFGIALFLGAAIALFYYAQISD